MFLVGTPQVRRILTELGCTAWVEFNLDEMHDERAAVHAELIRQTGQSAAPYVYVGGKLIGGCGPTKALKSEGLLPGMLVAAGAVLVKPSPGADAPSAMAGVSPAKCAAARVSDLCSTFMMYPEVRIANARSPHDDAAYVRVSAPGALLVPPAYPSSAPGPIRPRQIVENRQVRIASFFVLVISLVVAICFKTNWAYWMMVRQTFCPSVAIWKEVGPPLVPSSAAQKTIISQIPLPAGRSGSCARPPSSFAAAGP